MRWGNLVNTGAGMCLSALGYGDVCRKHAQEQKEGAGGEGMMAFSNRARCSRQARQLTKPHFVSFCLLIQS